MNTNKVNDPRQLENAIRIKKNTEKRKVKKTATRNEKGSYKEVNTTRKLCLEKKINQRLTIREEL